MDHYNLELQHARWTWLEHKHSRYHRKPRHKDRIFGRNAKRSARQRERRELDKEIR